MPTCMYSSSRSSVRLMAWCMSLAATSMRMASENTSAAPPSGPGEPMNFCTPPNILTARVTFSGPSFKSDVGMPPCRGHSGFNI